MLVPVLQVCRCWCSACKILIPSCKEKGWLFLRHSLVIMMFIYVFCFVLFYLFILSSVVFGWKGEMI